MQDSSSDCVVNREVLQLTKCFINLDQKLFYSERTDISLTENIELIQTFTII